jgi:hypothetical protein
MSRFKAVTSTDRTMRVSSQDAERDREAQLGQERRWERGQHGERGREHAAD